MEFKLKEENGYVEIEGYRDGARIGKANCYFQDTPMVNNARIGTIGNLELSNLENSIELINRCIQILKEKGITKIVGPMNRTTWGEYRAVKYNSGEPKFLLENVASERFNEVFIESGFKEMYTYTSTKGRIEDAYIPSILSDIEETINSNGITLRKFNKDEWKQDLKKIFSVALYGFSNNPLYTDVPEEVFLEQYSKYIQMCDTDFVYIAEKDDKAIGFLFSMPDFNEGQNPKTLILKTIAVLPEYENLSLGSLMLEKVRKTAVDKGFKEWIFAFMYKNNTSQRMAKRNHTQVIREYVLYEKDINE